MALVTVFGLFLATAVCDIFGCYLVFLWRTEGRSAWLLPLSAFSLAAFAWLLTLHPQEAAGRTYAAYGGIYVVTSLAWITVVERKAMTLYDVGGVAVICLGTALIYFGPSARMV